MSRISPTIPGCALQPIRGASDARGRINFVETGADLDFAMRRAFWIHGVPTGQNRGHHAHRQAQLLVVALSGAVDIVLDDGRRRETIPLDSPDRGIVVGAMVWHELHRFADGTVVLVLASTGYDEADYIRDYATFRREAAAQEKR
jgi:dTDP-4-dehydrorhamnose 3,5-epimerase-like enzyme